MEGLAGGPVAKLVNDPITGPATGRGDWRRR